MSRLSCQKQYAWTWTLTEKDKRFINFFKMRCSQCTLGRSVNRIRNDEIQRELGVKTPILDAIRRKRQKWYGHVISRHKQKCVNASYIQNFTKREQIHKDLGTAEWVAKDRDTWKRLTDGNIHPTSIPPLAWNLVPSNTFSIVYISYFRIITFSRNHRASSEFQRRFVVFYVVLKEKVRWSILATTKVYKKT